MQQVLTEKEIFEESGCAQFQPMLVVKICFNVCHSQIGYDSVLKYFNTSSLCTVSNAYSGFVMRLTGKKAPTLFAVHSRVVFGTCIAVVICFIKCSATAPVLICREGQRLGNRLLSTAFEKNQGKIDYHMKVTLKGTKK